MKDYTPQKLKAISNLQNKGFAVTFVQKTVHDSGYDSDGNLIDPEDNPADASVSGFGVKLNYSPKDFSSSMNSDSANIEHGDCKLIFACENGVVKVGMITTIDGEEWRVINPNPFQPASVIIYYEVQLRR